MPNAIIIGATSGIGRALAVELSRRGYAVGITGRREELLRSLQQELPGSSTISVMDVTDPDAAAAQLESLAAEMGGMDLLVISSGVGVPNPNMDWEPERQTLVVNVMGFAAIAAAGYRYFAKQGRGHLVGISSIAGIRGGRFNLAYAASKAFVINYLEGLRARAHHDGVRMIVTDIRPGYVATPMTERNQHMFWVASAEVAARQIAGAIARKKRVAYVTTRWTIIAWLIRHIPNWLLERV